MLTFAAYYIEPARLIAVLKDVRWTVLVAVCLGYLGSQALTSAKWWLLARSAGIEATVGRAIRAGFIGSYLNCFGLGTVGGDVARAIVLTGEPSRRAASFASVAADRMLGMGVLASIGVFSVILFRAGSIESSLILPSIAVCILVPVSWVLAPKVLALILDRFPWAAKRSKGVLEAFPTNRGTLFLASGISLVFHLWQIGLFALITYGLGAHIPWAYLLVAIPFANIASNLPLSWMGLGIRENAYIFFFVPAYLTREQALASGAIWLLSMTIASAVGAVLAVMTGDLRLLREDGECPEGVASLDA